jgi:LPXTG-site transpeptidase (sortase) family protein
VRRPRAWARLLPGAGLLAAGLLLVLGASLAMVWAAGRPSVQVAHADPHRTAVASPGAVATPTERATPTAPGPVRAGLAAISNYAAGRQVEGRPAQPRTGTWIELPALEVALPLREGDGGDRIPQWVALHYPGTAAPGGAGNSYVYAHGLWGMFGGLLYARAGDAVLVRDYGTGRVVTLHVSRVVGRIHWDDTSWIRHQSPAPMLTLQTCIDDSPHGDRFIVLAT